MKQISIPTAAEEHVNRIITVVMSEDPRELKAEGLETVYKHPSSTVLSVQEITEASSTENPTPSFFKKLENAASKGFLVKISVPQNDFNEVMTVLRQEILITKIDGVKTNTGILLEDNISRLQTIAEHDSNQSNASCRIM
jgi:hypothetical protein